MQASATASASERELYGLLAEYESGEVLLEAAREVRDAGHTRWDCYTPYPVHGLDRAMGLRDTRLPWVVLIGGVVGCGVAILMQWWMNAVDYPLIIGGKPFFSLPANIPVAFEMTILFAAVATIGGLLLMIGLPRFHHPVFSSNRFRRVTTDGFFVEIEAADPRFDLQHTERFLESLGCARVERLGD